MRDYEELVGRLRDSADWADHFAVLMGRDSDVSSEIKREAADAIEELSEDNAALNGVVTNLLEQLADLGKTSKWTSVKDALPKEERKTYWVYTNDGSQHECRWTNNRFGLGESDKWGWSVFDIPQYTIVTHWMPLPEPPKEDDNG